MNRGLMPYLLGCLLLVGVPFPIRADNSPPDSTKKAKLETLDTAKASLALKDELDRLRLVPPLHLAPPFDLIQLSPSPNPGGLPKGVPHDLADASRSYSAFSSALQLAQTKARERKSIDFQVNRERFWKTVDSILSNAPGVMADDLMAFKWAGFCGTGSDAFTEPYSVVLFIALVREKRFEEAAGAALTIPPPFNSEITPFWNYLGIDPQMLAAGGLLLRGGYQSDRLWDFLADGSESGARLMIRMSRITPSGSIKPLGRLLEKNESSLGRTRHGSFVSYSSRPSQNRPTSPEAQKEIIARLDEIIDEDRSFQTALDTAKTVRDAKAPEIIQTLKKLYHHPSQAVSDIAADALRSRGEAIKFRPAAPPLLLHILVNGTPYSKDRLQYQINDTQYSRTTSPNGTIELDRDRFIEPDKIPSSIQIKAPNRHAPNEPLFAATIPITAPPDEKGYTIDVQTKPVELQLVFPKTFKAKEGTQIILAIRAVSESPFSSRKITFKTGVTDKISFSAIQPGTYEIELKAPGIATYHSGKIELDGGIHPIQLAHGSDLPIKLITPEGWHPNHLSRRLLHNGTPIEWHRFFDFETSTLQGLPTGDYTLQIPSSAEQRKSPSGYVPEKGEFNGVERAFRIDENSPPSIDLGEINLLTN